MINAIFTEYTNHLEKLPISPLTKKNYACRVKKYLDWLSGCVEPETALKDVHAKDYSVRDFKLRLQQIDKASPNTVNAVLAALDNFYMFLGMGKVNAARQELPQTAPRALDQDEMKRFLRTVERQPLMRDRVIALIMFYTGLRISEVAALNVGDILLTARKGEVIVRCGKGMKFRRVPLHQDLRAVLQNYLLELTDKSEYAPLFISRKGGRLAVRSIDEMIGRLAEEANIEMSAHVLRHTCLTTLIRKCGVDIVTVAEIAGHSRVDTTRRYSLPTEEDKANAIDRLPSMIA